MKNQHFAPSRPPRQVPTGATWSPCAGLLAPNPPSHCSFSLGLGATKLQIYEPQRKMHDKSDHHIKKHEKIANFHALSLPARGQSGRFGPLLQPSWSPRCFQFDMGATKLPATLHRPSSKASAGSAKRLQLLPRHFSYGFLLSIFLLVIHSKGLF